MVAMVEFPRLVFYCHNFDSILILIMYHGHLIVAMILTGDC